jgi:DNA (cytosine-5)-methyltransferase 1
VKALDLFSCIGGHSIGLAAAGIETIAFCEKDEWRREILAMHFPGIEIYDDVDTTPALPADIYVGGPPCQGTSVAAAIHGTRDGRTLWPSMLRLVSEGSPEWVVVEQPPGNEEWESQVQGSLEDLGYRVSWHNVEASSFGLLCRRRRRYAIACRDEARLALAGRSLASAIEQAERTSSQRNARCVSVPRDLRVGHGVPAGVVGITKETSGRVRRIKAIGDSNPPVMMEAVGRAIVAASTLTEQHRQED